jgi:nucleoid DNA-binding protein
LVPKKAKEFIPLVAKELNLDEDLVDVIVNTYWKEVRLALNELKANRVNVINFGIFISRKNRLVETEKKYMNFLKERPDVTTFRRYALLKDTQLRLDRVRNLLEDYKQLKLKKQTVKEKKDAYKTQNNLEKPEGDISGTTQ